MFIDILNAKMLSVMYVNIILTAFITQNMIDKHQENKKNTPGVMKL